EFRGGGQRPRRDQRALRGAPLPFLRQLLRMRQLLWRLPRQRGDQAWARQKVQVRLRLLQGLRPLRRRVPVRGDRHGGGGDLTVRATKSGILVGLSNVVTS